jgi:sterol 24-C-methyltransferase
MENSTGSFFQGAAPAAEVKAAVGGYANAFDARSGERRKSAGRIAEAYYSLATDFYEYGWGQSFHFAPRRKGEGLKQSILRNERELAQKLGLGVGMSALDVGCGVGGPMRNIARFSGAKVTGITNAPYHVQRWRHHNARAGLADQCEVVGADFNEMPFEAGRFDAAYSIESCCHAGDRRGPFGEVFRVLKPGALFVGTDWCLTAAYVPGNAEHERIRQGIEKGNGIADLRQTSDVDAALRVSGFELVEARDLSEDADAEVPWYAPLASGLSLRGFRNSRLGAAMTHALVRVLEATKLSPPGTVQVHDVLRLAQAALVEGGESGIFTPHYFWLARKPI